VILSSAGAGAFGTSDCTWYFPAASSEVVWIDIPDGQVRPDMELSASALVRLEHSSSVCSDTYEDAGGSMTLSVRDGSVNGSLALSFPSGSVTGSFGVSLCGAQPGWAPTCQ
jgi:hypothetical protein